MYHWIQDTVKVGKLLPMHYYMKHEKRLLENVKLFFGMDADLNLEEMELYECLKAEACNMGAIIVNESTDADITVSQFVSDLSKRFVNAVSPFWIHRIMTSNCYEEPYLAMDYPCPLTSITSDNPVRISVSGFSQGERESIVAMITLAGAMYTTDLSPSNTHLIVPELRDSTKSVKVKWAENWGVTIRERSWLERSFFQWVWLPYP